MCLDHKSLSQAWKAQNPAVAAEALLVIWSRKATHSWEELGTKGCLSSEETWLAPSLSQYPHANMPLLLTTSTTSLFPKSHFPPPHLAPAPKSWSSHPPRHSSQLRGKAHWPGFREEVIEQAQHTSMLSEGPTSLPLRLVTLLLGSRWGPGKWD